MATYESLIGIPVSDSFTTDVEDVTATVTCLPNICKPPKEDADSRIKKALVCLRNGELAERLFSARELGDIVFVEGIKIPAAVVPLSVTLRNDPEAAVRQEAAWSLWKIGEARAAKPLMEALVEDSSPRVREKAARALGLLGITDALPVMIELLSLGKHVPARLRGALIASLSFLGDESTLPHLLRACEDSEPSVRVEAVAALGRYLVGFGDKVSDELLQKLKSFAHQRSEPQSHIRQAAVKALKFSGDNRAGQIVARALTCDPCHVVREVAAETLLVWNCAETERALIDGLADDFWKTRKAAARTLATFIIRYGVYDSAAVCEALTRMERMFPQASRERRLIQRAKVHLKYSGSPQIR